MSDHDDTVTAAAATATSVEDDVIECVAVSHTHHYHLSPHFKHTNK